MRYLAYVPLAIFVIYQLWRIRKFKKNPMYPLPYPIPQPYIDSLIEHCHCGAPAVKSEFSPNMDGYCQDCTDARCDAYPGECPNYKRVIDPER